MKKRTTMLMSALFAAGAFAFNGNVAKADNVAQQPTTNTKDKENKTSTALENQKAAVNQKENELANLQSEKTQAQEKVNETSNAYAPIEQELNSKTKAANEANTAVKQNEEETSKSQQQLNEANNAVSTSDETIASSQQSLAADKSNLSNAKKSLADTQSRADELNRQANEINTKLAATKIKQNNAQAVLDKYAVKNTVTVPKEYTDTINKWAKIKDDIYAAGGSMSAAQSDQEDQEMTAASKIGREINKYKSNSTDENHQVDIHHMSKDDQIELNKFALDMLNQARVQMGRTPWTLNKTVLNMANDIAAGYVKDNYDIFKASGHDDTAVNDAAKKYGLAQSTGKGQYYENMDSSWLSTSTNMNSIKEAVYNSIINIIFSDSEWLHASGLLSYGWQDYRAKVPTYAAISLSVQPSNGLVLIHYISVPDDGYSSAIGGNDSAYDGLDNFILDRKKFNTNDNISLDNGKELEKAKKDYSDATNDINSLTNQKKNLDSQLEPLNAAIKQDQETINKLESSIKTLTETLNNAETTKVTAQNEIKTLTARINDLQNQYQDLVEKQTQAAKDLADFTATHQNAIDNYKEAKAELDKIDGQIAKVKADKKNLEDDIVRIQARLSEVAKNHTLTSTNKVILDGHKAASNSIVTYSINKNIQTVGLSNQAVDTTATTEHTYKVNINKAATNSKQLPQAGTKESLFASLVGVALAFIGLGALGTDRRKKN